MDYEAHTARAQLEHAIEDAIALLDLLDGDPDIEDDDPDFENGDEQDDDGDRLDYSGDGGPPSEDEPIFAGRGTHSRAERAEIARVATWIEARCQRLVDLDYGVRP